MSYEVIDDFLPDNQAAILYRLITNEPPAKTGEDALDWYNCQAISTAPPTEHNIYMMHLMYYEHKPVSRYIKYFDALGAALKVQALLRIKINLSYAATSKPPDEITEQLWHTDYEKLSGHKTAVYYVNDSDGGTDLREPDGSITHIEHERNRVLIMDGGRMHRAVQNQESFRRFVVNVNYF